MELPEVEVMRRDLEKDVVGLRIKEAEVKSSKNAMRSIRRHKTRKEPFSTYLLLIAAIQGGIGIGLAVW